MKQLTLSELTDPKLKRELSQENLFEIPSPPQAESITDNLDGQTYAIVERLLEEKEKWVERWRLVRRIKKRVGQEPGNFSARISQARSLIKKFNLFIDWNGNKNMKHSAYRIFELDVGLPGKVSTNVSR